MRYNEIKSDSVRLSEVAGWDVIDDTGPPGRTQSDTMAPVNAQPVKISHQGRGSPILRFRKDAAAIEAMLPAPATGMVRLWRGNRPGEIGHNPSFTNSLAGIALPFRASYGGDISYVDVPAADLKRYLVTSGGAPGAEFQVPMALAAQARRIAVEPQETLGEAVFTTAPLKKTIFGNNHASWDAFQSEEPVPIYYRLGQSDVVRLLGKTSSLRTVITPQEVYVADAHLAAHAGMRSVLKPYGVAREDCINTIITGPKRMTYAWGKYLQDDPQQRRWLAIRQAILDNPGVRRMFPQGLTIVRDEWT